MEISVVLEPNELGGFTVSLPSVPGCVSEGDTKEEALKNFKEALELHLELDEAELPQDNSFTVEKITI